MQNCNLYSKNKVERYKFYGKIKVLEKFIKVWGSIVINWIIKLPLLKKFIINMIYNLILVVINRFIKYAYFLSYIEKSGIEEFVY